MAQGVSSPRGTHEGRTAGSRARRMPKTPGARQNITSLQSTVYKQAGGRLPWDGNENPRDGSTNPWDVSLAARPTSPAPPHPAAPAGPPDRLPAPRKGRIKDVAIFRSFNALTNSAQNGRQKESTCFPPKASRPSQPCPPDASPLRSSRSTPVTRGTARKNEQTSETAWAASTPASPNHAGSKKMRGMKNKP